MRVAIKRRKNANAVRDGNVMAMSVGNWIRVGSHAKGKSVSDGNEKNLTENASATVRKNHVERLGILVR